MSLINDALQRAKEAEQKNPQQPPTDPPFRPIEPVHEEEKPRSWKPILIGLLIVTFFYLLWQHNRDGIAPESDNSQQGTPRISKRAPSQTPGQTPAPPIEIVTMDPLPEEFAALSPEVETAATQPPALRLQAVFYSPTKPSAIISGETVVVGSKIRNFRVQAITPLSATLVSATETNVLRLN